MSILGMGIDLCSVVRIEKAMENPRFGQRIFTQGEREHIKERGVQSAAGIFAAKEAAAKALGVGFDGIFPDKIEVYWDEAGCPLCRLHAGAMERFELLHGSNLRISITHEGDMAAAVAILE